MNVLTKNVENRSQVEFVSSEQMLPADHLLRQIDSAIDFNKIYEFTGNLYCKGNGRLSIGPVVLFKIVLIQHIYGIRSLHRVPEEISINMAYRWFIGDPLNKSVGLAGGFSTHCRAAGSLLPLLLLRGGAPRRSSFATADGEQPLFSGDGSV